MWRQILFSLMMVSMVKCMQFQYLDEGLVDMPWYDRDMHWSRPLAVLSDRPYSLSQDMARIPLLAVPSHDMALLTNPYVSSYSPDSNLVTCQLNKVSLQAVPAIKVVLPMPVLLAGEEGSLRFPSHLSVESHGVRFMMPVGALLAPVPDESYQPYHVLNIVYAIPTSPFRQPFPQPEYPTYLPISYPKPNGVTLVKDHITNTPIRILEFPTRIETPAALMKPLSQIDEELVNRGPPQEVVIPAGLVQSTQPKPFLENFVNSKESTLLQSFRDEANKHRDFTAKPAVEAL